MKQSSEIAREIARRRTFAIISHPDAGKTTLTEKLLLFGGAIQMAGAVKAKRAARHATSDWMAMERERGISISSSVMQFTYADHIINLLDTPGHADFSEDTYRTLTAVDSALMVIDCAKGVEERTAKLMDVCRMRRTPIMTFINKLDREGREPIELLDQIEDELGIACAPVTYPIGMGRRLRGVYHLLEDQVYLFDAGRNYVRQDAARIAGADEEALGEALGEDRLVELREEIELVRGASHSFDPEAYLDAKQTPVFFGSAINNFGVPPLLDAFVRHAPSPQHQRTEQRVIEAGEDQLTGFVFKIQANMDPAHRDRIAFLRVCSGQFDKGMKIHQVRSGKQMKIANPLIFLAQERDSTERAYPGDIVGLHNHGTIRVGDSFSEGEELRFTGIPSFAPELFRRVRLKDPLKMKALHKGLEQLAEEGATQFFRPVVGNDLVVGAIGILQFEVTAHRLREEYHVDAAFENVPIHTVRWVVGPTKELEKFRDKQAMNLATDAAGELVYLASTRVNLQLTEERWPELRFLATREL